MSRRTTLHAPSPSKSEPSPVAGIAVADIREEYERRNLAAMSDMALGGAVADVIRVPRRDRANSFILHSALELEARVGLLPLVPAADRELARLHIVAIAAQYEDFGPAMEEPLDNTAELPSSADPMAWLVDAISAGDLDDTDRAAAAVAAIGRPDTLPAALIDVLATPTAAAAHAPIFLFHFARVAPRGGLTPELLRPLARELARNPTWRIEWVDEHRAADTTPHDLESALLDTPILGVPGNTFIHPLMMQIEAHEASSGRLSGACGRFNTEAAQRIMRVAARSMLQEPSDHAPYGWSHCLTMPQAVLGLAPLSNNPDRLLAVAATHVAAFRAGEGSGPLEYTDPADHEPVDIEAVVSEAATSHDAHVVKYVLACLDASAMDPDAAPLYHAAARRLLDVWIERGGDPTDPLAVSSR